MRKCKLFCWMIAVILPLSSFAQGVDFKELTMQEALALAGKEKKMILPQKTSFNAVYERSPAPDFAVRAIFCIRGLHYPA